MTDCFFFNKDIECQVFAENDDGPYIAYVSQQNLLHDENLDPCSHPQISSVFDGLKDGKYVLKESNLQ